MKDFSALKQNLKKDFSAFKKIKLFLLGDSATQWLKMALRACGYDHALDLEISEADFGQIEQQAFDPNSSLHRFEPDVIVVFRSTQKLLEQFNDTPASRQMHFWEDQTAAATLLLDAFTRAGNTRVILYNYPETDDAVFGNFANKTPASFLFQLRKLNVALMELALHNNPVYLCDLSGLQNQLGRNALFQPSLYYTAGMAMGMEALPAVAEKTLAIINSLYGKMKKCIVVDLDNTLWGGVIGDDGLEHIELGNLGLGRAFTDFQHWLKKLKNRGILLAVCSKNSKSVALEPFLKHPEMVLKADDFSAFIANWQAKNENLETIQHMLNIGFDAMVFLDDNPFERNLVRQSLPQVCVPELPEDPAAWLEYLYGLNLFETSGYLHEEGSRTLQYREEAERKATREQFATTGQYLLSLAMKATTAPLSPFNLPRAAQLTQRTNQFNLRTIRYTEAELEKIRNNPACFSFTFTLEDRFGDYGMVGLVILRQLSAQNLFIDTWLISCRAFGRGLENFMLNTILRHARAGGYQTVTGEYIPTPKNEPAKNFFENGGFTFNEGQWHIGTEGYLPAEHFISTKNQHHE